MKNKEVIPFTIFDPVIFVIILEIFFEKQCSEKSLEVVVVWLIEETHTQHI